MRPKNGIRCSLVALLFVFTVMFVCKAEAKSTCYVLYYDSNCDPWDYKQWSFLYLSMDNLGNFSDQFGDSGVWEYYGSSMHLSYQSDSSNCYALLAGTKKQGFWKCTDGSWGGAYYPGCWYLKKTKAYNCPWMD